MNFQNSMCSYFKKKVLNPLGGGGPTMKAQNINHKSVFIELKRFI